MPQTIHQRVGDRRFFHDTDKGASPPSQESGSKAARTVEPDRNWHEDIREDHGHESLSKNVNDAWIAELKATNTFNNSPEVVAEIHQGTATLTLTSLERLIVLAILLCLADDDLFYHLREIRRVKLVHAATDPKYSGEDCNPKGKSCKAPHIHQCKVPRGKHHPRGRAQTSNVCRPWSEPGEDTAPNIRI